MAPRVGCRVAERLGMTSNDVTRQINVRTQTGSKHEKCAPLWIKHVDSAAFQGEEVLQAVAVRVSASAGGETDLLQMKD